MDNIDIDYEEVIEDIARILEIDPPTLNHDQSLLPSDTALAAANPYTWDVVLKEGLLVPDAMFALAHELRHLWQHRNGWNILDAKDPSVTNKQEYNLQKHEIDANAFGVIYMSKYHLRPLLNGHTDRVKALIYRRVDEIIGGK